MERSLRLFLAVIASLAFLASPAEAQYLPVQEGQGGTLPNFLFAQYATPAGPSSVTAGLYPAPHPVPGYVGNVGYTYQPLQPHELMWQHSRSYYNYYAGPEAFYRDPCNCNGGGGLNKTTVVWQSGANHMGPLPFSYVPLAKLHYHRAQRRYCIGGDCQSGNCNSGNCPTGNCYGN